MAYLETRKGKHTGLWACDAEFKHADGSRTRWHKVFKTKAEAEGAEAYYRATGQQPPGLVSGPTHSFAAVAERFKAKYPEWLNAHDGRTNAQRLERVVAFLGRRDIKHVRTAALEELVEHLMERAGVASKPPSKRTINRYLDAASKVLRYAHVLDLIPGVPALPKLADQGEDREALPEALEDAICASMEGRGLYDHAFVVRVLCATGMRCGELWGLRPEQIETPAERIEHTGIALTARQTKTKAPRWVPILPDVARRLRVLIASNRLPLRHQVYKAFKRSLKMCGETRSYTLHCCRHATVTRLKASGAEDLDVAVIVGHSTGTMTQRYYHPDKARLFEVAKKVQGRCGETVKKGEIVELPAMKKAI